MYRRCMSWFADNFTPMWIVGLIALLLLGFMLGAVIYRHKRGETLTETIGIHPLTFVAIGLFSASILLGPLYTAFSEPTLDDWWQSLAFRVVWQLGSAVLMAIGVLFEARRGGTLGDWKVWLMLVGFVVAGALLCIQEERDWIAGPVVLRGTPSVDVVKTHGVRGAGGIWATLTLHQPDGTAEEIDTSGWGATLLGDKLGHCENADQIDVTLLRHVDAVLDVACK